MNDTAIEITQLLSDGEYHDGTSIGKQLNITRAAVWKVIQKLVNYGVPVSSIKGKGYRLETPFILLNSAKIASLLPQKSLKIEVLEKVDSTNQYLKTYLSGHKDRRVCLAEMQTHGRGRLNRQWHSPFGQNIYLSLLYPFQKDISELSGLSLVVSLALCRAIESSLSPSEQLWIKWPNDVMVANQKIAGILIEIQAESNGFCQVIIGIGVNVNLQNVAVNDISQPWSSLQKLTGQYHDRNLICATLLQQLLRYLEQFTHSGLAAFMTEWQQRDVLLGHPVTVLSGKNTYSGIGNGIDEHGHLLLKLPDGSLQSISSGDATLQK